MYEDHLKTCEYCQNSDRNKVSVLKPTIFVKSASNYRKERKLTELAAIIKGVSYPPISIPVSRTKGASVVRKPGLIEREVKLRELGKIIRGPRLT